MESRKNTDERIGRAAVEMETWRTDLGAQWGKERVGRIEGVVWKHHLDYCSSAVSFEFRKCVLQFCCSFSRLFGLF